MSAPTGLDAQYGMAEESTYGTGVTVTRFYEILKDGYKQDVARLESKAIRTGVRVQRSDRYREGSKTVVGAPQFEVLNKSFGLWFKHMFGGLATTGPVGTLYTHTFTPGALTTLSRTVQVGRPDLSGTVEPFTYEGCKVDTWELSSGVDEALVLSIGDVGEEEKSPVSSPAGAALATASYPSTAAMLIFVDGAITVGGVTTPVKKFSLKGDNGIAKDRRFVGSQVIKNPLEAAKRMYTGELNCEFTDTVAYGRFIAGTEAALIITFAVTISAVTFSLTITCNVRFDGETPNVEDEGILQEKIPFKCVDSGAGAQTAITLAYVTTDATP